MNQIETTTAETDEIVRGYLSGYEGVNPGPTDNNLFSVRVAKRS